MSLDTVLKIGKALRTSDDWLRHFKYVKACPTDKNGNYPLCLNIPVSENFTIKWNETTLVPENQRDNLFYLTYKTSDSDGLIKYIFGDIYYSKNSKIINKNNIEITEGGYFRVDNPNASKAYKINSFERAEKDFSEMIKDYKDKNKLTLINFRKSFKENYHLIDLILKNISAINYYFTNFQEIDFFEFISNNNLVANTTCKQVLKNISKQNLKLLDDDFNQSELTIDKINTLKKLDFGEIFLHFSFPFQKHWYSFSDDFNLITESMLSDFVDKVPEGFVLKKTLYKTLCSGDKKNDIQFPNFEIDSRHKSQLFNEESIQDLFYAVDYSQKGKLISRTSIKIIVLPKGDNLKAKDYINFQNNLSEKDVINNNTENETNYGEPLFDILEDKKIDNITSFDVVFSKIGKKTPDVDLIEISNIQKSKLNDIKNRIDKIKFDIYNKRKSYLYYIKKNLHNFTISYSLQLILGSPQTDLKTGKVNIKTNPRYQSHILKVLPLIYTDNYYNDALLIPSFIKNVEFTIRAGDSKFNLLKFDLEFLLSIQNNPNNTFMNITKSSSYLIGNLLGSLAKNFAGANSPIKSFEKNYVGNLSRRIGSISDFIHLKNDIEQKLIMHEKTKFTYQISYDLAQLVKNFNGPYNKDECCFGFFEAYFKPIVKKQEVQEIERNDTEI